MSEHQTPEDVVAQQLEELVQRSGSIAVLSAVQLLMKGGATPNNAFRLAAFLLVEDLGKEAVASVGMHSRSVSRFRAEIRQYRDAALASGDDLEQVESVARIVARSIRDNS